MMVALCYAVEKALLLIEHDGSSMLCSRGSITAVCTWRQLYVMQYEEALLLIACDGSWQYHEALLLIAHSSTCIIHMDTNYSIRHNILLLPSNSTSFEQKQPSSGTFPKNLNNQGRI
jgi:hypothetical protein